MGACSFEAFWKLQARVGQLDSGMVMQDITKSPPPRLAQPRISQLEAVPSSMQEHDAKPLLEYALLSHLHTAATVGDVFSP